MKQKNVKYLEESEIERIEEKIAEMPVNNFLSDFKDYINVLNQINY